MTKNRDLKGVANDLVETFISRNNDVSGYWGIGMLYSEALERSASLIDMDLIADQAHPDGPIAKAVLSHYSTYLASRLGSLRILSARIILEFGSFGNHAEPRHSSHGDPFVCTVSLTSAVGRTYVSTRAGRSEPHSANDMN